MSPVRRPLPPAARLLLAAGRDPGPGAAPLAAAAAAVDIAGDDWDAALVLAAAHGLLPLLARRLADAGVAPPPSAAARLRRAALAAAAKAELHRSEVGRVSGLFAAAGVAAVPWKGVILAEQAHGDAALRDPGDVDFLVARADAGRAVDLLVAAGCRPILPLTPRQRRAALANAPALTLADEGRDLTVDLSWGFFRPFVPLAFSPGLLVAAARPGTAAGLAVPVPPDEELLAALCLHAARHRFARLAWPCDVAGFARRRPGLDWERLLAVARRGGVLRGVLAGLAAADDLFGAALPPVVRGAVDADRAARRLAREATAAAAGAVAGGANAVAGTGGSVADHADAAAGTADAVGRGGLPGTRRGRAIAGIRWQLRALDRAGDRLRLLARWATATNEEDWAWVRLPDALFPLHALLRPVRLIAQNLRFRRRA